MTDARKQELLDLNLTKDEIKFLAKEIGFNLSTIPPKVPFSPCICGKGRRMVSLWSRTTDDMKQFKCDCCGFEGGWAKTQTQAKLSWNASVAKALEEKDKKGDAN